MAINEERFSKLYASLDKEGIDPDTLWEIENIAKRVSVIPFEKGRLTLMDDGVLKIELLIPDEDKLLVIHTYVGKNVQDGLLGADCSFVVWKNDGNKNEMVDSGSWWLDYVIECNREYDPRLDFGGRHPRMIREEWMKDAYYNDIYDPGKENEVPEKFKNACEEILDKLSYHRISMEHKNGRYCITLQPGNGVIFDIFFKPEEEGYNYYFSQFRKTIDKGFSPDIETILDLWYNKYSKEGE